MLRGKGLEVSKIYSKYGEKQLLDSHSNPLIKGALYQNRGTSLYFYFTGEVDSEGFPQFLGETGLIAPHPEGGRVSWYKMRADEKEIIEKLRSQANFLESRYLTTRSQDPSRPTIADKIRKLIH